MNPLCFIIIPFFLYKFLQFYIFSKFNYNKFSEDGGQSILLFAFVCFVMMIVSPSIVFTTQVVREFGKYQRKIDSTIIGYETKPAYSCSIGCPDVDFTPSDACGIMASHGEEGYCVGGFTCEGMGRGCRSSSNIICQVSCIHSFNLVLNVSYVVDNKKYTGQAIGANCEGSFEECNIFWQNQTELQAGQIFTGYYNPVNNGDFTEKKKTYAMKRLIIIGTIELFLLVVFILIVIYAKTTNKDEPVITKVEKIDITTAPAVIKIDDVAAPVVIEIPTNVKE